MKTLQACTAVVLTVFTAAALAQGPTRPGTRFGDDDAPRPELRAGDDRPVQPDGMPRRSVRRNEPPEAIRDRRIPAPHSLQPPPASAAVSTTLSDKSDDDANEGILVMSSDDADVPNGETPNESVIFNYHEEDLIKVIEAIAKLTGRNFDVDPNLGAVKVTVITHDAIPADMAYEVLESILASRGFTMQETLNGNLVKIVPIGQATEKQDVIQGTHGLKGYDTWHTHIVNVQYANAEEVSSLLKNLGSESATVDVYARTNTLIISDTADGVRRMWDVLEAIDIPGSETQMEIFVLEYTQADVLSEQIVQILEEEASPATPAGPAKPRPRRTVRPVSRREEPLVVGASDEMLKIVPDERLNALVVLATEGKMEQVRDLVQRLDTPTPYEANNMHIYELLNADVEEVEEALSALVSAATPRAAANKRGEQSEEIQPFEKNVSITRYNQTNALLILASPQDYKRLEAIIAQLDMPQRQVHVAAVILDVTMSENTALSVDAASISGNDAFGMSSTPNLTSLYQVTDLVNELTSGTMAANTALRLLDLGSTNTLTAGIYDTINFEIAGQNVGVPFVPFLLQALESVSDADVLSEPSLLMVDNEEAKIIVGKDVPIVQGTTRSTESNESSLSGYTRVSREEVGVKLTVTPQISEGDYISLELDVEVSSLASGSGAVGDPNVLGPTFLKSNIKNRVIVKDGATGVIGGLISDSSLREVSQTPFLGDVPLLGWLFKHRNRSRDKHNLVVFVTPHIIKEGTDLERITERKLSDFGDLSVDYFFDQGILKKIKRRSSDPGITADRLDKALRKDGYDRGNMP